MADDKGNSSFQPQLSRVWSWAERQGPSQSAGSVFRGLLPWFGRREPKPTHEDEDEKQPAVIRTQQWPHDGGPFKPKSW